ncbi:unnamed protein product [Notodromas monacha]|uniref:Uncharacterized protein n=1 Tax=Notodromas monacha TaxID=399045 RepID=A0A7R9BVT0_9CRUS|nr:unnamed protein product [Notodromas monacha]CAG0921147.1 unnamed protein product [Notodromas monacha]
MKGCCGNRIICLLRALDGILCFRVPVFWRILGGMLGVLGLIYGVINLMCAWQDYTGGNCKGTVAQMVQCDSAGRFSMLYSISALLLIFGAFLNAWPLFPPFIIGTVIIIAYIISWDALVFCRFALRQLNTASIVLMVLLILSAILYTLTALRCCGLAAPTGCSPPRDSDPQCCPPEDTPCPQQPACVEPTEAAPAAEPCCCQQQPCSGEHQQHESSQVATEQQPCPAKHATMRQWLLQLSMWKLVGSKGATSSFMRDSNDSHHRRIDPPLGELILFLIFYYKQRRLSGKIRVSEEEVAHLDCGAQRARPMKQVKYAQLL